MISIIVAWFSKFKLKLAAFAAAIVAARIWLWNRDRSIKKDVVNELDKQDQKQASDIRDAVRDARSGNVSTRIIYRD